MALAKHGEEISERRTANGAAIIYEYQHPQANGRRRKTDMAEKSANPYLLSPEELKEAREAIRRINQKCEERMASEMTLLCKWEEHDKGVVVTALGFMTKSEAAKITGWLASAQILSLDTYGGFIVSCGYLFISERRVAEGLRKYGMHEEALITGILRDRQAERNREKERALQDALAG